VNDKLQCLRPVFAACLFIYKNFYEFVDLTHYAAVR
jgi:hypothetical protein